MVVKVLSAVAGLLSLCSKVPHRNSWWPSVMPTTCRPTSATVTWLELPGMVTRRGWFSSQDHQHGDVGLRGEGAGGRLLAGVEPHPGGLEDGGSHREVGVLVGWLLIAAVDDQVLSSRW